MADRSGKARAEAVELERVKAESADAQNRLGWLRTRARMEREARAAVEDEIAESARRGIFVPVDATRGWSQWEFARRQIETFIDQLAAESTSA